MLRLLGPQGRIAVVSILVYLVGTVNVSTVRGLVREINISLLPHVVKPG